MDASVSAAFRGQLVDRRRQIASALERLGEAGDLMRLLQEIDDALGRLDMGRYGECIVCHEEVDERHLQAHPALQYCLCDLKPEQISALESDLDLAGRIQWSLLPEQDLLCAGWRSHFRYQPAGHVSGDMCDLIVCPGDSEELYFLIGDVTGKGVAASLFMSHIDAIFRSLIEPAIPVDRLVTRANELLTKRSIVSRYATLVCGRAVDDGTVEICNAGHCPPVVLGPGRIVAVEATGLPVGMFGATPFTSSRVALEPGETLFLYTDGLSEAQDRSANEYGASKMLEVLQAHAAAEPGEIAEAVLRDSYRFGGGPWRDDLTLLILRREV